MEFLSLSRRRSSVRNVPSGEEPGEIHGGAKSRPKGLITAKFTYFLHFFSFLDQTCQIDYDCWPNDIKFLFDAKC